MELFAEMITKRPESALAAINFVYMWFHEPVYDGQEWETGGDGKLRYFDDIGTKLCCCFISLVLNTAARKLNLTLEYADSENKSKNENSILSDYFGNNVIIKTNLFKFKLNDMKIINNFCL